MNLGRFLVVASSMLERNLIFTNPLHHIDAICLRGIVIFSRTTCQNHGLSLDEVQKEIKKDAPSRLHARRQMLKVLYPVKEVPAAAAGKKKNTVEVDLTAKLFEEIAPKYADRNGGYTRIVKIGQRKGDAAMEVVLELV